MKKLILALFAISILSISPTTLKAESSFPTPPPIETKIEILSLLNRLDEINEMDKSNINRVEKKALRKEVKTIQKELKRANGGIYLSAGAVIIIVVLLILFL